MGCIACPSIEYLGQMEREIAMRRIFVMMMVSLALAACQTTEEKVQARLKNWVEACGYPVGENVMLSPEEARVLRSCVAAHESAYQLERAQNIQRGQAMMSYGASLMATPY